MTAKRYAIINGSTVIAAIMWDAEASPDYVFPSPHTQVLEHAKAGEGWFYIGGEFMDPNPEPEPEPEPELGPSDYVLTRRQIRAALILNGILDPDAWMTGVMATLEDPVTRALALNDWANAPAYQRGHALFSNPALLASAGMTSAALDALWMQAKDLPE